MLQRSGSGRYKTEKIPHANIQKSRENRVRIPE